MPDRPHDPQERIAFHFDPLCPWCYQTSRWVRRLAALGVVEVDWRVFSLALANAATDEGRAKAAAKGHHRGAPALRTVMVVRDAAGSDGVGRFYAAVGAAIHERGEPAEDPDVIRGALKEADLDPGLFDDALADDAAWDRVVAEHTALVEGTRSFGVPTLRVGAEPGGDPARGPAIFGPVIVDVPDDDDAVELFRHVAWLTRYEGFAELKRDRTRMPDLESVRRFLERQRAEGRPPDVT